MHRIIFTIQSFRSLNELKNNYNFRSFHLVFIALHTDHMNKFRFLPLKLNLNHQNEIAKYLCLVNYYSK